MALVSTKVKQFPFIYGVLLYTSVCQSLGQRTSDPEPLRIFTPHQQII